MSHQALDEACEGYLQSNFGEPVDFAIERSLPELLQDGMITEDNVCRSCACCTLRSAYTTTYILQLQPLAQDIPAALPCPHQLRLLAYVSTSSPLCSCMC